MRKWSNNECQEFERAWHSSEKLENTIEIFERIYECLYEFLFKFTKNMTGNKALTEDLVQTAFLDLYKKKNAAIVSVKAWLITAVRYKKIDDHRKHHTENRLLEEVLDDLQVSDISELHNRIFLEEILRMLPEQDQELLRLKAEDLTHGEIGYVIGLTEGAVKQRFNVIKGKIKELVRVKR
jgi:RNA polymerase sigma factor (sigma-70 family)